MTYYFSKIFWVRIGELVNIIGSSFIIVDYIIRYNNRQPEEDFADISIVSVIPYKRAENPISNEEIVNEIMSRFTQVEISGEMLAKNLKFVGEDSTKENEYIEISAQTQYKDLVDSKWYQEREDLTCSICMENMAVNQMISITNCKG